MSLNVQTVVLDLEKHKFLGISIVGQNNETGDGGIYIGSIMKGGAVAADGRIEAGDMLLQGTLTCINTTITLSNSDTLSSFFRFIELELYVFP